jgi:hypothetical protein
MARPKGSPKLGGRKKGTPNKATASREREIAKAGATPLDVMLKRMRYHDMKADAALRKQDDVEAERHMVAAEDAANRAAPYVHPKLASMQHTGRNGGPIQTVDLTKLSGDELDRLEDILGPLADAGGDTGGEGAPGG